MPVPQRRGASALALVGLTAALACAVATSSQAAGNGNSYGNGGAPLGPTMDIQLLSFNDFHGNLEPPSGSSARLVIGHTLAAGATKPTDVTSDSLTPPGLGGAEYLATHLADDDHADGSGQSGKGSRLPWKSLKDSSWMSIVGPRGAHPLP